MTSVKRIQLVASRLVENLLAGDYRSVFRGPGIEFDEVREYVEGDDARLIDWNVSSRMDSPFTKTFREERELTLMVLVDLSASLAFGPVAPKEAGQPLARLGPVTVKGQVGQQRLGFKRRRLGQPLVPIVDLERAQERQAQGGHWPTLLQDWNRTHVHCSLERPGSQCLPCSSGLARGTESLGVT
ncbi:MAG: DUF58 domain-containing protein [Anaerolineae bacterium]